MFFLLGLSMAESIFYNISHTRPVNEYPYGETLECGRGTHVSISKKSPLLLITVPYY